MSEKTAPDDSTGTIDTRLSLRDLQRVRDREDIDVTSETEEHEDFDHCTADVAGQVVVAVENDDGEFLFLRNDELGVAILPHGNVEEGEDWAAVARKEVEALTGVSITLEGIELLRDIDHVVEGDGTPHRTTSRVIFAGRPVGGEIQDCKQNADAGSDGWWACWASDLPDGVEAPGGGPGDDLRYVLD